MYSVISVRVVGNNSLIHLLRILTSLQLFLNHEFPSKHPVLTDVYNNGKAVLGEKLFCSFESVFELATGLGDSQTSINKKYLRSTCKERDWNYMQRQRLSFLCVLVLKKNEIAKFFLKELKKPPEITEKKQNISLSSKEIISPESFALKAFPS